MTRPPALLDRALRAVIPSSMEATVADEMEELYELRYAERGGRAALSWYIGEIVLFIWYRVTGRMAGGVMGSRSSAARESRVVDVLREIRVAARTLAKSPLYVAATAGTLALGIGANATVFTLANWVLLRPVPGVRDPETVMHLRANIEQGAMQFHTMFSEPDLEDLRKGLPSVLITAMTQHEVHLSTPDGGARIVSGAMVSSNYFEVFGVAIRAGRRLGAEDMQTGSRNALISERLWRSAFGGSSSAIGASVIVNGRPVTIVGVAGGGFQGGELPARTDMWFTAASAQLLTPYYPADAAHLRGMPLWGDLFARSSGPGPEAIAATGNVLLANMRAAHLDDTQRLKGEVLRVYEGVGGPIEERQSVNRTLLVMGVSSVFLLLLAISNAANLALARGANRGRGQAVRRALGASRARILRELMYEHVMTALVAGVLAVALTYAGIGLFRGGSLASFGANLEGLAVDARVVVFLFGAALFTGVLFGLGPAWIATRFAPTTLLQSGARASVGGARTRSALVIAQFALSITLLVGAGLLSRTLWTMQHVDLGIDQRGVRIASVSPGTQGYSPDRRSLFARQLLTSLRAQPSVRNAALVYPAPLTPVFMPSTVGPKDLPAVKTKPWSYEITDGLFDVMGMRIIQGRDFTPEEASGFTEPVAIINQRLARALFGNASPIGKVLEDRRSMTGEGPYRIVGVVSDARFHSITEPPGLYFFKPFGGKLPPSLMTILTRADERVAAIAGSAAAAVAVVDPALPVADDESLVRHIARQSEQQHAAGTLAIAAAVIGTLLAGIGLAASLATLISDRKQELAIRVALGGTTSRLLADILKYGLALAVIGSVIGLIGGYATSGAVRSLLWGVRWFDGATYASAFIIAITLATVACFVPGWRVTRVDPASVLRQ